ncbi:MAG: YfhO family protein [Gemmataceae bacterium]|nr:YfhO family protein [Gemmataceae bacterium]
MTALAFLRRSAAPLEAETPQTPVARRPRSHRTADRLALSALTLLVVLLFWPYISGEATLLGNTDRPNTYLNILKFHTESIRNSGLTAWNDSLFTGLNTFGIVYTYPNPLTYLAALAPPDQLFYVAGLISVGLLVVSGWAAYAFIRSVCKHRLYAFIGAALYELSFLVVFNACQNDMSFVVHILIPLVMLALRAARPGHQGWPFVALAGMLWVLFFFTFLQVAAYAMILFGLYTLHRARIQRNWSPVRVFMAAFAVALIAALPRIWTIKQEMELVIRNKPGFPEHSFLTTSPREGLRFFADGIFGRNQGQMIGMGNHLNSSEGVLLYISSFAAFLILFAAIRYRGEWLGLFFYEDGDRSFFMWLLVLCFAVILVQPLTYILYLAFMGANFHHARLITIAVLPACTLVSLLLWSLDRTLVRSRLDLRRRVLTWGMSALTAGVLVSGIHLLAVSGNQAHRVNLDQPFPRLGYSLLKCLCYLKPRNLYQWSDSNFWHECFSDCYLHPYAVRQLFWTLVVFLVILYQLHRVSRLSAWRPYLVGCLGFLMVGQLYVSADFRVNANLDRRPGAGPITNNNDIQVARKHEFQPPSETAIAAFADRLEREKYRSVLISPVANYPTQCPPHISQFWRMRLFEGYGTAVPTRLFALPFPMFAYGIQWMSYTRVDQVDWQLLSMLNVKYAVVVNDSLYRNAAPTDDGHVREATPTDVTIFENPYSPVPRAFFVKRLEPVPDIGGGLLALFGDPVYQHTRWAFRDWPPEERERLENNLTIDGPQLPGYLADGVAHTSCVEGWTRPSKFDTEGSIDARFRGDRIEIDVEPRENLRFLVLNELYHPAWRAYVDGEEVKVYPTNLYMRGLPVAPGATQIVLEFQPFVVRPVAWRWYGAGLALLLAGFVFWRWRDSRVARGVCGVRF